VLLAFVVALAGCEAPPRPSPGMAAIRVEVRAQPKAGFRDGGAGAYGDDDTPLVGPGFERVNYKELRGIIVWAEPLSGAPSSAVAATSEAHTRIEPPLSIRSDDGSIPVVAIPLGGECLVRNDLKAAESIFSVAAGNAFDLGAIAPGGVATIRPVRSGLVELLSDSRERPVAVMFVAPTRWVSPARVGSPAYLIDLPPGKCRVHAWHDRFPESATIIELHADKIEPVKLTIGVNELPKATE